MDVPPIHLNFWSKPRLKLIRSDERSECLLACLAMISTHFGHEIDLRTLRQRYPVSVHGMGLDKLEEVARDGLQLQSRPVKLPQLDMLMSIPKPCILHWEMNHFVVLDSINRKGTQITVLDPAIGRRVLTVNEVDQSFTGVATILTPAADFREIRETRKLKTRSLMGRVQRLSEHMTAMLVLALTLQALVLTGPWFMQLVIDDAIVSGDAPMIPALVGGFILISLMKMLIGGTQTWYGIAFSKPLNFVWAGAAAGRVFRTAPGWLEKRHTGDIVSRMNSLPVLQHGMTTQVIQAVIDAIMVVGALSMMLLYSPKLAALSLVVVCVYTGLKVLMFRRMMDMSGKLIVAQAEQQTHFMESIRAINSIKLNGKEEQRRVGYQQKLSSQTNAEISIAKLNLIYSQANATMFEIERYVMIGLATYLIFEHRGFTIGAMVGFMAYKEQFSTRVSSLIDKLFDLKLLPLQGERVAEILLAKAEERSPVSIDTNILSGRIEFRNIRFRYGVDADWVLDDFSIVIEPGEYVAIKGASGCGKSTLIKLMTGLLTPNEGDILIGGQNVRHLKWDAARRIMGTVMQDEMLLSGSLADNITMFDERVDDEHMIRCAQWACVYDEIMSMPMMFHTMVGDLGTGLSGGQRQRVLLARALHRKPKILVLDEATSNLDQRSEAIVNSWIDRIPVTRVVVAHRESTINRARRVIELGMGGVILSDIANIGPAAS